MSSSPQPGETVKPQRPAWQGALFRVARIGVAFLIVVHGYLWLAQEQMLFYPRPLQAHVAAAVRKAVPGVEEVTLAGADGTRLHGWFVPAHGAGAAAPVLIYFGGNAEEVSGFALDAGELPGVALAFFNYRGYGLSKGQPGEQALFADALAVYDHIAARADVDAKRIVVMGRSLGSGVAAYLASQRPAGAVILVTPYDSIAAVAQAMYPFVLVDLLLRHRFDSASRAPSIRAPALVIAASRDTLIPPAHAAALAKAWRGPVTHVVLAGADHNDVHHHAEYWPRIRGFLRASFSAAGRGAPGH